MSGTPAATCPTRLQILPRRAPQLGLTLTEAAAALAVASTLVGAALPSMSALLDGQRLGAGATELVAGLHLARAEAIARAEPVVIAARDGRDWSSGWRTFVDANDNGRLDTGEPVLREVEQLPAGMRIEARFGATYSGAMLSYRPTGSLERPGGGRIVLGRLVLSNARGETRSVCFASLSFRVTAGSVCG